MFGATEIIAGTGVSKHSSPRLLDLMQAIHIELEKVIVDLGYQGMYKAKPDIDIKHRGKFKSLTDEDKKDLKRRQSIEPIIGHLKSDHRMNRCYLKASLDDRLHGVQCAAGYQSEQHAIMTLASLI